MLRTLSRLAAQTLTRKALAPLVTEVPTSSQAVHTSAAVASAGSAPEPTPLDVIRARIFGTHLGNGLPSGRKILRKRLCGEKVASWYLEPIAKHDPLYVDPRHEKRLQRLDRLRRRGKGPPKKGQGRRTAKR